jgi:hypothetical protein
MYQKYKTKIHLPYSSQPKFFIPSIIIQLFKSKPSLKNYSYEIYIDLCSKSYNHQPFKKKNLFKPLNYLEKKQLTYFLNPNCGKKKYPECEIKCCLIKNIAKNFYFHHYEKNQKKSNVLDVVNLYFIRSSSNLFNCNLNKDWVFFKYRFKIYFTLNLKYSERFILEFSKIIEHIYYYNK